MVSKKRRSWLLKLVPLKIKAVVAISKSKYEISALLEKKPLLEKNYKAAKKATKMSDPIDPKSNKVAFFDVK